MQLIKEFYKSYLNFEAYNLNFPENIIKNYFLIIGNIYYFSLKEACLELKEEHLLSKNLSKEETSKKLSLFLTFYKKKLKSVRKQVLNKFNIENQYNNIDTKVYLRTIQYYFPWNSYFRLKATLIKCIVDEIFKYLENNDVTVELLLEKFNKIINYVDDIQTEVDIYQFIFQ